MYEILKMFVDADIAMAGVAVVLVILTIAVVQGVKRILPSPQQANVNLPEDKWKVADWLSWVPFLMAFVVGMVLSVVFDPQAGQPFRGKLRDGIQTGAYAVVAWEAYSVVVRPIIDRIGKKESGG